jgi:hypothetical protein
MIKHTPGPWKHETVTKTVYNRDTGKPKDDKTTWVRAGKDDDPLACVVGDHPEDDACLIALVPEMFEIIEYLGSGRERNPNIYIAMDKAMRIFERLRDKAHLTADHIREVANND